MKKKIMAMLLGCVLAIAITACGSAESTTATEDSKAEEIVENAEEVTSEASDESVEATDTESNSSDAAVEEEPINVESNYQISRTVYGIVSDKVFDWEFNYSDISIDERGNVISEKISGSNNHTMSYEYDSNNRMVRALKETQLYGTEELLCTYNDEGLLVELHNIKTEKNGNVIENTYTYVYDENGNFASGQHIGGDGNTYDMAFENDDTGRILKLTETLNGETYGTTVYSYDEGVYNPTHVSAEKGDNRGYEEDLAYDDKGRVVNDDITYKKDGDVTAFECTYDVVGEVTESPESNPDLIPGDKWSFFEECSLLPVPSSCITTIQDGNSNTEFVLPTYKGYFFYSMGYPSFMSHILDSSYAMTALDQYTAILSEVLGYKVQPMGNIIKVSKDDQDIATLNLEIINSVYTLTVIPAE